MSALATQIAAQMDFLLRCDHLKTVTRTTRLHDGTRFENSAEHSWHLALAALTLAEHAPADLNIGQTIKLLLIHDLVEIGAGDLSFAADEAQLRLQASREQVAAAELFGTLPDPQAADYLALWQEFEAQRTLESRFARAIDAFQPMLLTWGPGAPGCLEQAPELTQARVLALKAPRLQAFPALWAYAQHLLNEAVERGILRAG